jgi:diguanylate cyclase (GGDEF)-like protein
VNKSLRFVKTFMIASLAVVALVVAATFVGFHLRTEKLTIGLVHQQAAALFRQVVLTRRWVTRHGGVFVKVQQGVNPNPYLTSIPGMKVTIRDQDGELYTLRNPGLVTREISQLANESGLFTVRIISLKPINVATNTPDDFEREALLSLERGEREVAQVQKTPKGPVYRYVGPLYYEDSCNSCHSHQGYQRGDIRGGISISIPMLKVSQEIAQNRLYTIVAGLLVFVVLFALLTVLSRRFISELGSSQDELLRLASIDSLTGLLNRKAVLERADSEISRSERTGAPLSCLLMDLDGFKEVNDTHGHQTGDTALRRLAQVLGEQVRRHDVVSRYGGEEFLVLLPETSAGAGLVVAEKIRRAVSIEPFPGEGASLSMTISIGLAVKRRGESLDSFISRADTALYRAKAEGRNRVCVANGDDEGDQQAPS